MRPSAEQQKQIKMGALEALNRHINVKKTDRTFIVDIDVWSYEPAKAAMLGLVPCLAMEGETLGIKVNGILPFAVSPMAQENPALAIPARDAAANVGYQRDIAHRSPPSTVTAATLYLASEACAISGECISAQAGRYARLGRILNAGWLAPTVEDLGPDDIAAHLAEIMAEGGEVPIRAMTDEFRDVRNRVFALEGKDG